MGHSPQGCRVVGGVTCAEATFVLAEGHIQDPVQGILNAPVPTDGAQPWVMGKEFTVLRRDSHYAWLQEYGYAEVRYALKYLADAYQTFFQGMCTFPASRADITRRMGSPSRQMSKQMTTACV